MTKLLVVNSSASGEHSVSNQLTAQLVRQIAALDPALDATIRDVGAEPLPHLTARTLGALRRAEPETAEERAAQALSDALVAELQAADVLVIGAPMYNFGIPSTLKAWFDHVLRAGVTFRYTENGPEGLLKGKRAIVVETRGGLYSEGPYAALDAQEPHLRAMLGFVGITDVTFIHAERLAMGPDARDAALNAAAAKLEQAAHGLKAAA